MEGFPCHYLHVHIIITHDLHYGGMAVWRRGTCFVRIAKDMEKKKGGGEGRWGSEKGGEGGREGGK